MTKTCCQYVKIDNKILLCLKLKTLLSLSCFV